MTKAIGKPPIEWYAERFREKYFEWITFTSDGKYVILPDAPDEVWEEYKYFNIKRYRPTREEVNNTLDSLGYTKSIIIRGHGELNFWRKNTKWYSFIAVDSKYVIHPKAPKRVKESFNLWVKDNPDNVLFFQNADNSVFNINEIDETFHQSRMQDKANELGEFYIFYVYSRTGYNGDIAVDKITGVCRPFVVNLYSHENLERLNSADLTEEDRAYNFEIWKLLEPKIENTYWITNREWFDIDTDNYKFSIKDDAPERAKKSFEMWVKDNPD